MRAPPNAHDTDAAAAAPAAAPQPAAAAAAAEDFSGETIFYEGNAGSNAELAISLLLGLTLVYAPLTLASVGRRLWINFKITDKRLIVENTSPLFKGRQTQVAFSSELTTGERASGHSERGC